MLTELAVPVPPHRAPGLVALIRSATQCRDLAFPLGVLEGHSQGGRIFASPDADARHGAVVLASDSGFWGVYSHDASLWGGPVLELLRRIGGWTCLYSHPHARWANRLEKGLGSRGNRIDRSCFETLTGRAAAAKETKDAGEAGDAGEDSGASEASDTGSAMGEAGAAGAAVEDDGGRRGTSQTATATATVASTPTTDELLFGGEGGLTLQSVTERAMIERVRRFNSWHQSTWSDADSFEAAGAVGVVVVARNHRIVACCVSAFVGGGCHELDIMVQPAYRGRGLASLCAARVLRILRVPPPVAPDLSRSSSLHGSSRKRARTATRSIDTTCRNSASAGVSASWSCDTDNKASRRIAEKLGFLYVKDTASYECTEPANTADSTDDTTADGKGELLGRMAERRGGGGRGVMSTRGQANKKRRGGVGGVL